MIFVVAHMVLPSVTGQYVLFLLTHAQAIIGPVGDTGAYQLPDAS